MTILGDDELVPTFPGIGGIESDLEYSLRDGADEMPDVALGRIVGDDAAGVTTAVNKIITYENSPPGGDWLRKATVAAEFQDDEAPDQNEDRTFILFAETARNGILNTPGVRADRRPDLRDVPGRRRRSGRVPRRHPASGRARKPGFAWDGDTADITAAWNDGRYLMMHRDHGATHAWDNPRFTSEDADALTNGAELPVVLSINCSSGAFQDDDRALATQALVNPNGGAAGVFGDTEVSPTDHNTQIALGLPRRAGAPRPGRRGPGHEAAHRRGADPRQAAAGVDRALGPGTPTAATRDELYLWHYFGDPSMQMWGGEPDQHPRPAPFRRDVPPEFTSCPPRAGPAALRRGGDAAGGVQRPGVQPAAQRSGGRQGHRRRRQAHPGGVRRAAKPGELLVAFEGDGARPVTIPVDGVPKRQTQLKMIARRASARTPQPPLPALCRQRSRRDRRVDVHSPNGRSGTRTRTVTTNDRGEWSDTFDTGAANDGQGGPNGGVWTVSARYAGDSGNEGSGPVECKFPEASS